MLAGVKPNQQHQSAFRVRKVFSRSQHLRHALARQTQYPAQTGPLAASDEMGLDARREGIPQRSVEAGPQRLASPFPFAQGFGRRVTGCFDAGFHEKDR